MHMFRRSEPPVRRYAGHVGRIKPGFAILSPRTPVFLCAVYNPKGALRWLALYIHVSAQFVRWRPVIPNAICFNIHIAGTIARQVHF